MPPFDDDEQWINAAEHGVWITAEGEIIPLVRMTDDHLERVKAMLERRPKRTGQIPWPFPNLQGEEAQAQAEAAWMEQEFQDDDGSIELSYEGIRAEIERRKRKAVAEHHKRGLFHRARGAAKRIAGLITSGHRPTSTRKVTL